MPVDEKYSIYYERQQGGLCRMHSVNAFFQEPRISIKDFNSHISDYDAYMRKKYNISTTSKSFDLVGADQTNIVGWILQQYGYYCRFYALNSFYRGTLDHLAYTSPFVFVYNENHIWGIMLKNQRHYKVDSIGGVHPFNMGDMIGIKNIGMMIPVGFECEWDKRISDISQILTTENIDTQGDMIMYLNMLYNNNMILGDMEIHIGVAIRVLELQLVNKDHDKYHALVTLVNMYNDFVELFSKCRYNDIKLILRYIPDIVFCLVSLGGKK